MKTRFLPLTLSLISTGVWMLSAQTYQKPPQEILEVLHARVSPMLMMNPPRTAAILAMPVRYPPISDLAEPMLRLGGLRINPRANAPHVGFYFVNATYKPLPGGAEVPLRLPEGLRAGSGVWNSTGTRFAFTSTTATGVDLWVVEVPALKPRRISDVQLNPVLGPVARERRMGAGVRVRS